MITLTRQSVSLAGVIAAIVVLGFLRINTASANPSQIIASNTTATTTLSYMTTGTATTTYYMDAQDDGGSVADTAVFLLNFVGSSTASSINIAYEYAQDNSGLDCVNNPTKCEWYADVLNFPNATTTPSIAPLTATRVFSLPYASTTVGGIGGTGNSRNTRILTVLTPSRYVRAVITMPLASLNGAVWGNFLRKRQQR